MAGNIKGVTIEFQADATKLNKELRNISKDTAKIDKELKGVNNALKFNPTSVEHWRKKQELLTAKIQDTKSKLKILKDEQAAMKTAGIERTSEEYRKLQREIVETESKLKTFKTQLVEVGDVRLTALSEGLTKIGGKMTDVGRDLTTKVTVPLTLLGGAAVKNFAEIDKIMVLTNSTMGNTAEQAEMLNKAMKDAAANSTYGMQDAATATLNFARAGLTAEQAAAALAPAMNLAAGEGGNLDTVSAGLVATINGFHGSFDEAERYADVFANACNNSALDVDSLANAMSVAAPIFSAAGYSIEDAALYMGIMANNGIEADKAANSLKTGLARLVSPAKDGAEAMEALGISITNSDGTMKDTITVQKELHDAFGQLSESEQIAAASAIFGKNQMAPWLALINSAPEDVNALAESIGLEGTATQMATDKMSGFGGTIEQLKSNIDVASASLGEALAPAIQTIVGWIQAAVDWFNSLDETTREKIATVGLVIAAIGPLLLILGTLFTAVGNIIGVISKLNMLFTMASGPIGIAIAAIGLLIAAGVWVYQNWDMLKNMAGQLRDWVVDKWNSLKDGVVNAVTTVKEKALFYWEALKTGIQVIVETIKNKVTGAWDAVKTKTVSVFNAVKSAIITPIQNAVDFIKNAVDKIKGFFSGLRIELPHIKLPHFSLQGEFSLMPPRVPTIGIDWYKTGGIFNSPTVYPIGIGEAGPEAVVPLDTLWRKLDRIADSKVAGERNITFNIYPTEGMSAREIAEEVRRILIEDERDRGLAYGIA